MGIKLKFFRRFKWIEEDLLHLITAVAELPAAVAETVARVAETIEVVGIAVAIALVLMLIAYIMHLTIGKALVPAGHVAYETAHVLDGIINWFIGAWRKIAHFFHFHASSTKLNIEGNLVAFKSKFECSAYESYTGTVAYVIQRYTSRHVCPVARYVYSTLLFQPLWVIDLCFFLKKNYFPFFIYIERKK